MDASPQHSGLVFVADRNLDVAIEVRVNFGLFAGRAVTLWEIERLSTWLLDEVDSVTIISEDRHQIGREGGGAVHQVRVEIAADDAPASAAERHTLEDRLLERLDYWARTCFADRHSELEDV